MSGAVTFFAIATFMAVLYRAMGEARLRVVERHSDTAPSHLLQLKRANRVTSIAGIVAAVALVLLALASTLDLVQ